MVAYLTETVPHLNPSTRFRPDIPADAQQVVLTQNGMDRDPDAPVIFEARLLVEVYAGDDEVAVEDAAREAYHALSSLTHRSVAGWWVQRVDEVAGLAAYPDVARQLPRWQFTVAARVRGTDAPTGGAAPLDAPLPYVLA